MAPGLFTPAPAHASADIAAPIGTVWQVVTDIGRYGEWNPFVTGIDGPVGRPARVGDDLRLHVRWRTGSTTRTTERVTRLDPPADGRAFFAYAYRGPIAAFGLVRGLREQRLAATPGGTRYETTEALHGLLVRFAPLRLVQDGLQRHAAALKTRAEALHEAGPRPQ
ncbi:SRPBCC domain-containing protein [Microbacterium sp.]|uniref:SRPBCC domain-containing protein n=1 Tax=Microbacterium sp. TaxID=51671 RepID=UPI003A89C70E